MIERPALLGLRETFPIFSERLYFASHCLGPISRETYADFDAYRQSLVLRNRALQAWIERVDETRTLVAELLGAAPDSIALGANATASQAMLAAALSPVGARNRILVTNLDFRSSRYLWNAQAARGFDVQTIASPDGMSMPTEGLVAAIDERVAVVAVSLVSYFNGAMLDLQPVLQAARAAGALVVLDAYQAVGAMPIDVTALGVDALVGGTHKWLGGGGTGLSFLYVRPGLAEQLAPAYPGWLAHADTFAYPESFTPAPGARRFEQGTPPMEPIYTARAGIRFVLRVGLAALRERSLMLGDRLLAGLDERGIPVASPRARAQRSSMLCVAVDRAADIALALRERGIDIDTRPGTGLRVSTHALNTEEECDRFVEELATLRAAS